MVHLDALKPAKQRAMNLVIPSAGCRGLAVRALISGDKVHGFKSRPRQSGFFYGFFFFFFIIIFPRLVRTLSDRGSLANAFSWITTCYRGGKREVSWKNPSSAICEVNTNVRRMFVRKGIKKFSHSKLLDPHIM